MTLGDLARYSRGYIKVVATDNADEILILNGTFPVGLAIEGGPGGNNRTIIVKERLIAWLTAQDLKGA